MHKMQEIDRRIMHVQYDSFYETHLKNPMEKTCKKLYIKNSIQNLNTLTGTLFHINQAKVKLLMVTYVTPELSSYCPLVDS